MCWDARIGEAKAARYGVIVGSGSEIRFIEGLCNDPNYPDQLTND